MIVVNTCWVDAGISKGGLFNRCKNVSKNVNDPVRGFIKNMRVCVIMST